MNPFLNAPLRSALAGLIGVMLLMAPTRSGLLPAAVAEEIAPDARPQLPLGPLDLVPQRELPDPLVCFNGERVRTREEWYAKRRPGLKTLFQYYMYGTLPPPPPLSVQAVRVDTNRLDGRAILKQITLALGTKGAPAIHLLVVVPVGSTKPVPAFLGLNFCGNHTVLDDPVIALPTGWMTGFCESDGGPQATEASRGKATADWAITRSIQRGYAVATFYNGDIDPDRPDATNGIRHYYAQSGANFDWGSIAAWAWGLSRALDYLVTDPDLDPKRIAVVGHSRNGKAALLAAAFDERFAMAIPLQAGCGGTAPSRGTVGESVRQINEAFPHWFNARFKAFNDDPFRLPFDQHALIALCAPRPVLLPNAEEDTWANPAGQFEMLRAADGVYRFLGLDGLGATEMPRPGKLVPSRLGYFIRPGKHAMTAEDWNVFLEFADKHLGR